MVTGGDAAQGFVVDVELREGGGDLLIAPVEIGLAGDECQGFFTQGMGAIDFFGGK